LGDWEKEHDAACVGQTPPATTRNDATLDGEGDVVELRTHAKTRRGEALASKNDRKQQHEKKLLVVLVVVAAAGAMEQERKREGAETKHRAC